MKLWLIERTDETNWDETNAVVVRAEDETAARALALAHDPDYQISEWGHTPLHPGLRADNITVSELTPEGEPGVIIRDFIHG